MPIRTTLAITAAHDTLLRLVARKNDVRMQVLLDALIEQQAWIFEGARPVAASKTLTEMDLAELQRQSATKRSRLQEQIPALWARLWASHSPITTATVSESSAYLLTLHARALDTEPAAVLAYLLSELEEALTYSPDGLLDFERLPRAPARCDPNERKLVPTTDDAAVETQIQVTLARGLKTSNCSVYLDVLQQIKNNEHVQKTFYTLAAYVYEELAHWHATDFEAALTDGGYQQFWLAPHKKYPGRPVIVGLAYKALMDAYIPRWRIRWGDLVSAAGLTSFALQKGLLEPELPEALDEAEESGRYTSRQVRQLRKE